MWWEICLLGDRDRLVLLILWLLRLLHLWDCCAVLHWLWFLGVMLIPKFDSLFLSDSQFPCWIVINFLCSEQRNDLYSFAPFEGRIGNDWCIAFFFNHVESSWPDQCPPLSCACHIFRDLFCDPNCSDCKPGSIFRPLRGWSDQRSQGEFRWETSLCRQSVQWELISAAALTKSDCFGTQSKCRRIPKCGTTSWSQIVLRLRWRVRESGNDPMLWFFRSPRKWGDDGPVQSGHKGPPR